MLPGHVVCWIFSAAVVVKHTPLSKLTWMIKFSFPFPHHPSFSFALLQFPHVPSVTFSQPLSQCRGLPPMLSLCWGPGAAHHGQRIKQFRVIRASLCPWKQPSAAWWRWGFSWALPLPSIARAAEACPAYSWSHVSWAGWPFGQPRGPGARSRDLWGGRCLTCPQIPKGTHQSPRPWGSLERGHESARWKLPSLSQQ